MRNYTKLTSGRQAFTLLEVILALAILGGSVAVLGEIMRASGRHATDIQAESRAQLLARSQMDEMMAGFAPFAEKSRQPLEVEGPTRWLCSVSIGTTTRRGLVVIEVLVEQDLEPQFNPVKYKLVSWISSDALSNSQGNGSSTNGNSPGAGNA